MVIYLRIKQSVCISDVILVTVQAIVGSCWSMHVHIRYTRLDEKSHEATPNKDGLHDLHERKPRSVFNEKIKLCFCCHSNRFWRCQGILFNVVVRAIQALSEKKFGFATSINRNKKKNIYSNDSALRKKNKWQKSEYEKSCNHVCPLKPPMKLKFSNHVFPPVVYWGQKESTCTNVINTTVGLLNDVKGL